MRILIDTNIFIYREDDHVLSSTLQSTLRILNTLKVEILLHPNSVEEIKRDLDENRKKVMLSKIRTYPLLESPPNPNSDNNFLDVVGDSSKLNEYVDNVILYSVFRDAVDFLITEDKGIHNKAVRLGIKDRVLSLEDALDIFEKGFRDAKVGRPPALKEELVHNLNMNDPFFDSLKEEYSEFETWFKKISREGRRCWVHFREDNMIGALLIYKVEDEPIDSDPPFPAKKRLKISTLKVTHMGYKIGELFVKLSIEYSIKNDLAEIYLTHFTQPNDYLLDLITEYGFIKVAMNRRGEDVFVKKLLPDVKMIKSLPPIEISKKFYPNFYDGIKINKFVVPIRPKYHDRLFIDYTGRQTTLPEHTGEFIIEGNTIKKAYLSHSRTTKISSGDILLFYRSRDTQELTSLGIVESVYTGLKERTEFMRRIGKRTVYSLKEIEEIVKKPTMILLFTWHLHLANPLKLADLKEAHVLTGAPQSITKISHEKYLLVKSRGGIDERFTLD